MTIRRRLSVALSLVTAVVLLAALPAWSQTGAEVAVDELAVWKAVVLGLVEGLTEYLPISSTGHLLATNTLLGLDDTEASERAIETYTICIQAGAILAVLLLYRERMRQMLHGLRGHDDEGRRVLVAVVVAFVPTAIIGISLVDVVRDQLFGIVPVAVAWVAGGVVILVLARRDWFSRDGVEMGAITTHQAVLIGVAQAAALWPGVSRSMVTIIAAVAVGLTLRAAVEFSFLLGLVTLSSATVVEGYDGGADMIDTFGWFTPAVGLVVAFAAAMAAVRWMVTWLEERGFEVFGWYRLAVGLAALALVAADVL